jgi:hypothetical protein
LLRLAVLENLKITGLEIRNCRAGGITNDDADRDEEGGRTKGLRVLGRRR